MIGALEVLIIAAGGSAFVAVDHLDEAAVHAGAIRAEPLHQLGNVQDRGSLAGEAVD
ncbi:hypothetical protein [Mesorhizobium sp. B2-8-9]|uniref:hypothetical protein n=1 Tax=Mesorhizobium sp. B2-8-9 TaxID=2589899 RepID=UPI0015E3C9D4|nr:hypothetical protein [Mesorhizobium sp. B2-8-9]